QRRSASVGGPSKGAGDDADRGHASGFGHYSVVETPRRAGPSISDTVDDGIALRHQCVDRLRGAGGTVAEFSRVDHLPSPILLFQDFLQLLQESIGVVLAIFQETDDLAGDAGKLSAAAPCLGELFGAGVKDLDGTGLINHTPRTSLNMAVMPSYINR